VKTKDDRKTRKKGNELQVQEGIGAGEREKKEKD
jgi:hypothetical protein